LVHDRHWLQIAAHFALFNLLVQHFKLRTFDRTAPWIIQAQVPVETYCCKRHKKFIVVGNEETDIMMHFQSCVGPQAGAAD
jgi:hypothetical protein